MVIPQIPKTELGCSNHCKFCLIEYPRDRKCSLVMEISSTAGLAAAERAPYWNNAISDAYFPLSLQFQEPLHFQGRLTRSAIGRIHLSQLVSDPVQYERCDRHIEPTEKQDYLITVPRASTVEFRQLGRDVSCNLGGFILEPGDEPYPFSYQEANNLFVLKVNKSDLSERLSQPDQYCTRVFDATQGAGAEFVSMVQETQKHAVAAGENAGELLSRQLLELLALAIRNDRKSSESNTSSVRAAHLVRIEKFVHENICNPHLSPELIASASGISKRYLHELFEDVNCTVSR